MIHCANGSLVHLPNSRGTRLLLMALANAGMSIPYEFLVQAGMTGPWELSGYQNCGKWTPSVPGGEGDSDENRDGHIGFEEGIHPVGGFLLEHCDKKALKAYRARLTKIREERLKAKAEGNGAALAALDEEAHRIESEIRNATDKTGAIRKKGPNAAEQRQFHACFERAIRIVGAQDAALGAYLKATLDRGAQFKFNGIGDEFVFDKGVLSSPTETARKAASINCLAGVGSSAENDY